MPFVTTIIKPCDDGQVPFVTAKAILSDAAFAAAAVVAASEVPCLACILETVSGSVLAGGTVSEAALKSSDDEQVSFVTTKAIVLDDGGQVPSVVKGDGGHVPSVIKI